MLNAIGLENVGLEAFKRDKMPFLRKFREMHGGRVIVNLFGTTLDEYVALAQELDGVHGVDGVEVNLSCPNVKAGGIEFGRVPAEVARVTSAVRRATSKFVAVKLSPASLVVDVARASADSGADAVCMGNTMPSMAVDVERRVSRLWAGVGGLSGPALRAITVRQVYQIAQAVSIPVIGIGGITNGEDALEFLLVGARAVQIGTATFADPNAIGKVYDGIASYLERQSEKRCADLVGTFTKPA